MKFSDVKLPSNHTFGFFFTAVFGISGAYFYVKSDLNLAFILISISTAFLFVTIVKSELLLPLNKLWMRLGLMLGMIISPIILGLMFFLLFTPIALMMRLIGRDELRLKSKPRASYWKVKEENPHSIEAFKYQY